MRGEIEILKRQIRIEDIADYLLGVPARVMYRFPGERTPSIKVYTDTNSFYDFGRCVGGDSIQLWSHVKGCNCWEAAREMASVFGISLDLSKENRKDIIAQIRREERAREVRKRNEKRRRQMWRRKVEALQEQVTLCNSLLNSGRIPPLSDVWCWAVNDRQKAEYYLDCLCGILD